MSKKVDKETMKKLPKSKAAHEAMVKAAAEKHAHHTYPTLTIRQAMILTECMKLGLEFGVTVDGMFVTGEEWVDLLRTIIRVG